MLLRKILIFELLLGLYFLLQTLLPLPFSRSSRFTFFLLLSLTKYHFEGFRINYTIFFLIQLLLLISNSIYLAIPVVIAVYFAVAYFPIYKYPNTTGPYRVGYKMIKVKGYNDVTSVGVYYPTYQKTKDVKYSPSHQSWKRFADLVRGFADYYKQVLIPKIVFKVALSFMEHQYLGVNKDAKIVKLEGNSKGFPVVVFSHGLAANIHIYSIMLKEWASHGFVIFSVDHDEEIHMKMSQFRDWDEYLVARNKQLAIRKFDVRSVLSLVCDSKYVHNLFEDNSVVFDYSNIFVGGHSFGGATVAEVAAEDKRVTGGMVLLDPWFGCSNEDILHKKVHKPILSIRSSLFNSAGTHRRDMITHIRSSNPNKSKTISGFFEDSGHNASSDLAILMPREMALFGKLGSMDEIEDHVVGHYIMTRTFLKKIVEKDEDETVDGYSSLRARVMESYEKELEGMKKKDIFIAD